MAEQKIGKYRILERIGRGGMGMIFKAHDPVLDRMVALKVISPEIDVTDELRVRFFREAQACARLNHPNIVTVYDLGEDEGRLFIVMELLEGQELRRLVAPGTPLTLEDKLSVMTQVCGGLYYAHQKGIVHRDMKPGNVFLLGNGRVKILDFGIAHMASTEEGLTRTGLIMGTLRYISPEQVRGRSDHRSDMFSIGSVFYELLTLRPAFTGDDPMHLLEQLRTQDPPSPSEIDASVPPVLAAIVQRAMRKEPGERFRDLEEMRVELEQVQRTVTEERYRISARVRGQRERLVQLQDQLAEQLGVPERAEVPAVDERKGLAAIQALERTLATRIAALEGRIAEAEAVEPVVQRAEALLAAGRLEEAVARFEAIVAEAPEHRRGLEGLKRAREAADAQWRGRRGAELAEKARAALRDHRYALCLEILKQAADLALPADVADEVRALRERALAEQDALHRLRQEVESASDDSEAARDSAQAEDAPRYAPDLWNEAQALMSAAEASLRRDAHAEAKADFERAADAYRRAEAAAAEARREERHGAEQARERATEAQRQARASDAAQYARGLWEAAEARLGEARVAFDKPAPGLGRVPFTEASALYRRAEEAAREARERERRRAEAARERAAEGCRSATAVDAERLAPSTWHDAGARAAAGEAAWLRGQYPRATEAFEAALGLYHQAQTHVREEARRRLEEGGRKREEVAEGRRRAEAAEAALHAPAEWAEAEASARAAEAALASQAWDDETEALDRTVALYRLAEERATNALRARAEAEQAGEDAAAARRGALQAAAATHAAQPWQAGETAQTRAVAAFSRQQYAEARAQFEQATHLYGEAGRVARLAADSIPRRTVSRDAAPEPAGTVTIVVEPPDTLVLAPTVMAPENGSWSAEPSGVEAPADSRTILPEPWTWPPPEPWRGRLPIIAGVLAGLVVLAFAALVFFHQTTPDPARRNPVGEPSATGKVDNPPAEAPEPARPRASADETQLPPRIVATRPKPGVTPPAETKPKPKVESKPAAEPAERARAEAPRVASPTRADVDKLAGRAGVARGAAEKAAAPFWASQAMTAAREKEGQAGKALERSDHAAAASLFTDAESEYRTAAEKARAAADAEHKVSALRGLVVESRAATAARRSEAMAAQAGRLARDEFDAAEATHRNADELDTRQELAAAAKAYEAAAAKYREAAGRAQAR